MTTSSGLRDVAIVGVGATPYYKRGGSLPKSITELAGEAILAACEDAGLPVTDVDGFAYYSGASAGYTEKMDTADFVETLGIPEVRFTAALTSGGGGSAGAIGLARAAIVAGDASVVVTVMALQQSKQRLGSVFSAIEPDPINSFLQPSGLFGPGQLMSVMARRHMHLYGTRREAFAEIALSTRANAANRPKAMHPEPLTLDDYFNARMIAEPLCLYDFCQETDGAVAVITTSINRANDLKQPPVPVVAAAHGGVRDWGRAFAWMGMPDEYFASSGNAPIAKRLYEQAGISADDIDVALLYDHFSPMVLMQLEDYGFCGKGEGGAFVESGAIRYNGGSIPVNTHGGQLSEAYIIGMTHIMEGVEQMRGTAINQVSDAELALVTGGPASLPVSGLILGARRMSASTAALATTIPGEDVRIAMNKDTEPFWRAAKERRLVAPQCGHCQTFRLPPTPFCPNCQSKKVNWVDLAGDAVIYSFAVVHGFPGMPDLVLVPAVLDLPDAPGARLVSNVVDVAPADVTIGMPVHVDFSPIADGWLLPVFRVDDEEQRRV